MDYFTQLTQSSNPLVAVLAALVVVLAAVVVYQWNYTTKNTVPKWIFDGVMVRVDRLIEMSTIIQERVGNSNGK